MAIARFHRMPFGAELTANGAVRFRLWAPDAERVELCLEETGARTFDMPSEQGGWFTVTTPHAAPGMRYRYCINEKIRVPDPASRFQPDGANGPSQVVDPAAYEWQSAWHGRPWEEAVVYELHLGTFTAGGTFESAIERLSYLAGLGVTALEVMPVATFAGSRNWGYDGVLPYAPHAAYGRPEQFKAFVEAAQAQGLMVLLDVVYNHFGPEGNYLHSYAAHFFTDRHQTPWGEAINYDGPHSRAVRDYFVHNALYWLEEYRLDGLRLDAVHAIVDDSTPDILEELADAVHRGPGRERPIHLVLENYDNEARYLRQNSSTARARYAAQWNDDFHHCCHTLLTGEADGYYADYADKPVARLTRCLSEGFAYQGEESRFDSNKKRGEPSGDVPSTAFIDFLQNHDQVGNRASGDRLVELASQPALRAATSILLLSPHVPGLFMGEEFGCRQPFLYFADFEGELAQAVRNGRKREFSSFEQFGSALPDPISVDTFRRSVLQWDRLSEPEHAQWLEFYRELLDLRRRFIVPRLPATGTESTGFAGDSGLLINWHMNDGARLSLLANLGRHTLIVESAVPEGRLLYAQPAEAGNSPRRLPAWSAVWRIGA